MLFIELTTLPVEMGFLAAPVKYISLLNFELRPLWPGLTITEKAFDT